MASPTTLAQAGLKMGQATAALIAPLAQDVAAVKSSIASLGTGGTGGSTGGTTNVGTIQSVAAFVRDYAGATTTPSPATGTGGATPPSTGSGTTTPGSTVPATAYSVLSLASLPPNPAATLTYTQAFTSDFSTADGWTIDQGAGAISSGILTMGGEFKRGSVLTQISGIPAGRRIKVEYKVAAGNTGAYLPGVSFASSDWQNWPSPVDPIPSEQDRAFTGNLTYFATAPANAAFAFVGVVPTGDAAKIDSITVSVSDTPAPSMELAPDPAVSSRFAVPVLARWAVLDVSSAPKDPNSAALRDRWLAEINYHKQANGGSWNVAANIYDYSTGTWAADSSTPRRDWGFFDPYGWGYRDGMFDGVKYALSKPTPANLVTSGGTDRATAIHNVVTDELWEDWGARVYKASEGDPAEWYKPALVAGKWYSSQGSYVKNVRTWDGRYNQIGVGVSASGLTHVATSITVEDVYYARIHGHFPHAINFELAWNRKASAKDACVYPATRNTDGADEDPNAIPYGARIRIPKDAVMPSTMKHELGPYFFKTLQIYGGIFQEKSGNPSLGFDGDFQHKANTGEDRWAPIINGNTWDITDGFPWELCDFVQLGWGEQARA